ncbi:MAG: hypothetical protein JSV30_04640 [Candidatus Omnitrophota bacterium]|nr:MAG: hypothetical protein JSV30_04640 [Candidatus Omnitrophota bacterium]
MKTKALFWTALFLSIALCGCASTPHTIGYDVSKPPMPPANLGKVYIAPLSDERPNQEREGIKGKVLTFSSRDKHFSKKVPQAIREVLSNELNSVGFSVIQKEESADYKITGSVKHFQAVMSPAKITFLPYLGSASTLWAKDDFTIALSLYIKMTNPDRSVLIDKTFDISQDLKLSTGLLNLARYSRGFNYKLKLLDEALKDVMTQIRDEAKAKVK